MFITAEEYRREIYRHILEIVKLYCEGVYTINDIVYILSSLVELGDVDRSVAEAIIQSPTVSTVEKVFNNVEPRYEIDGVPIDTPALVVTPSREHAVQLLDRYPHFTTSLRGEVTVVSIYRAISLIVLGRCRGRRIVVYRPTLFTGKAHDALRVLILMTTILNIPTISRPALIPRPLMEIETKLDLLDKYGREVIHVDIHVRDEFKPALRELWERYGRDEKIREMIKIYTGVDVREIPRREDWWRYSKATSNIDYNIYEEARKLFNDRIAEKIARWRVRDVRDVVKLLRDLKYDFRDENYFKSVVIPSICKMFNVDIDVVMRLLSNSL